MAHPEPGSDAWLAQVTEDIVDPGRPIIAPPSPPVDKALRACLFIAGAMAGYRQHALFYGTAEKVYRLQD